MQQIIVETFDIPAHLTHCEKVSDLYVAYAKFLAIQDVAKKLTQMKVVGTWTHKKPTLEDIVEIFMSRSGYFNRPHKFLPKVHNIPTVQKWLENGDDAPTETDAWGDRRPSYKNLKEILAAYETSGGKKKDKGKKKQTIDSPSHSSEEVVKGKGKEKAKAKKAGGSGKKKVGSSKSRLGDN